MSLYTHWVCFDCRKSFHKLPNETAWKCSECANLMTDMGVYFEPPKRQAKKRWEIMKLLAENGYKFQTEGSKFYIDAFILESKNPSIIRIRELITDSQQNSRNNFLKEKVKRYKEQKRDKTL